MIVAGALANKHLNGGEAWVRLNWVLALEALGMQVFFVEQIRSAACVDDAGQPTSFETSANVRFFTSTVSRFLSPGRWCLVCDDGPKTCGLPFEDLQAVCDGADLLVNISGHLRLAPLLRSIRKSAYIDVDPGFTQIWHAQGLGAMNIDDHDLHFTVGENIGQPGCEVPTCGVRWRPIPPFVMLDRWPLRPARTPDRLTTVAAWRGPFGPVTYQGTTYGLKVHEFRRVLPLPGLVPQTLEVALNIHPADAHDRASLIDHGWLLTDPQKAAATPEAFHEYVYGSGGEFSVAQGIYVGTRCGWVSDRTVHYLAAGRPALVQDTGVSRTYPVGHGLVPFRTLDEAAEGGRRIASDYDLHAAAARALAEDAFDARRVVTRFLDEVNP